MKKGSDDNYDLKAGSIIKNSEPYYDGLYDDNTLVSKKYVDLQDAKQDIAINSNSQLIGNKADLTKRTVQTFAGRIQVPDFDGNNHNLADVTNLRYVIGNYLNKNTGGILNKSIQFDTNNSNDDRQLFGLGTPKYNSSAVNKLYVDNAVASSGGGVDDSKYLYLDGSRQMTGNLNMSNNKIINSSDPTSDKDLVTKKYMETHVGNSHITSSDKSNVFSYVMNNPTLHLTGEDDITLGETKHLNTSPHMLSKTVVDGKLLLDSSKGYYSSRIGVNLYPLPNTNYRMAFELIWTDNNIDKKEVSLNGLSSIETIHNVSQRVFNDYVRLIIQFNKNQNIGNNYVYIDIVMKMKAGKLYPSQLDVYFICYGIYDSQSDVPTYVYDAIFNIDRNKIKMNGEIDMDDNAIIGIKESVYDSSAVNYKQLVAYCLTLENKLKSLINIKKNYYGQVFLYFFDCLDSDQYNVNKTSSGAFIDKINDKLIIKNTINLNDADIKNGLSLYGSHIILDETYNQDSDFTIMITFKHDTSNTRDNMIGFGSVNGNKILMIPPFAKVKADDFYLNETAQKDHSATILSSYRNKQLMLWFAKSNDFYEINLCNNGGLISESISASRFTSNKIIIALDYKIQRIGFSPIYHAANDAEFHKILFMEKSRGTFFQKIV